MNATINEQNQVGETTAEQAGEVKGREGGETPSVRAAAGETPPPCKVPPSERDIAVYELVAVQSRTTREAAAACGISQTRVRQVVAKVTEFLSEAIPAECAAMALERQLVAGERVASLRLDFLYGEALRMWRASQQNGNPGRVSYLGAAMRVAVAAAKLPLRPLPMLAEEATAKDETSVATPSPKQDSGGTRRAPNPSPVGDCSKPKASSIRNDQRAAPSVVVTLSPDEPCKPLSDRQQSARREFLRSAQRGEKVDLGSLARREGHSAG